MRIVEPPPRAAQVDAERLVTQVQAIRPQAVTDRLRAMAQPEEVLDLREELPETPILVQGRAVWSFRREGNPAATGRFRSADILLTQYSSKTAICKHRIETYPTPRIQLGSGQ